MKTKHTFLPILLGAALVAVPQLAHAAAGDLDTSFSGDGKATVSWSGTSYANSVAIQSDDKIVVAGYAPNPSGGTDDDFAICRFNTNGTLDTTFSGDGKQTVDFTTGTDSDLAVDVRIQSDGKIVVAGISNQGTTSQFVVARLTSAGALDATFDGDGKALITFPTGYDVYQCSGMRLQSDGKIVLGGDIIRTSDSPNTARGTIVRLTSSGSLDTTFSGDGFAFITPSQNVHVRDLAVQSSDGGIVYVGKTDGSNVEFIGRLTSSGVADSTFTPASITGLTNLSFEGVRIQSGQILAVGSAIPTGGNTNFLIARYNTNGSLDTTFSTDGFRVVDFGSGEVAYDAAIQTNGKMYIAGYTGYSGTGQDFALTRLNSNGDLDTTFDSGAIGKVTTNFSGNDIGQSIARTSDGRVVVVGVTGDDFAVARYLGPTATNPALRNKSANNF